MANFSEEAWMDPAKNTIALNRRMSGRPVDPVILVGPDGEPYHAGDVTVGGDVNFDKSGLATDTNQQLSLAQLTSIAASIANQATAARQDTGNTHLNTISSGITAINSELADHATRANQTAIISAINSLGSNNLNDVSTATLQQAGNVILGAIQTLLGSQATASGQTTITTAVNNMSSALVALLTESVHGGDAGNSSFPGIDTFDSSAEILSASPTRVEAIFHNSSDRTLFIRFSSGPASSSLYTFAVGPDETLVVDNYNGAITAIAESTGGTGNIAITNVTAS